MRSIWAQGLNLELVFRNAHTYPTLPCTLLIVYLSIILINAILNRFNYNL